MHTHRLNDTEALSVLDRLGALARQERHATVELIAHLAELDRRKLYRDEGYGSLFSYCTEALRLSEHAAYNRIVAARACRRVPILLDRLADGSLNLTTLRLLAPHLTPENAAQLVAEAGGRRKREVEALEARLAPQPDVPASVRKLPAPALARGSAETSTLPPSPAVVAPRHDVGPPPTAVRGPEGSADERGDPLSLARRPLVTPLTPERYRIQFTVSRETQEKLGRVQDLLRREVPDGDPGAIFDSALSLLLEDVARRKLAATATPRAGRGGNPHSRHIPSKSSGESGSATSDGARSHQPLVAGAASERSSSSITSSRMRSAARRRSRTSLCDAANTMSTKQRWRSVHGVFAPPTNEASVPNLEWCDRRDSQRIAPNPSWDKLR